jgi:Na+-translocating ferredoxin:NAD+ oxidoreductase RnfG subunit
VLAVMMELMWFCVGVLTSLAAISIMILSKQYRFNWIAWGGLGTGAFLMLFTIAWSVGSVLEGVPRAASMGIIFFAMPGIVLVTAIWKYIEAKLPKMSTVKPAVVPVIAIDTAVTSPPEVKIETPVEKSKLAASVRTGLRYTAYAALLLAFVYGRATSKKDYEGMVRSHFPDSSLTKVNESPLIFQLAEKKGDMGNYVMIQEGQGYGGPFVIGVRIMDDARVHEVMLLDSRETPAFLKMIQDAQFDKQFIGKHVSDDFIVGADIDAVSRATISTMAGTEAIRRGAHTAATQYFKLKPEWQKIPWKFGLGEILIVMLFILAFISKMHSHKILKYIYLVATISVVGFYLNASISIGNLSGLLMGYIPGARDHIIWWVLTAGTVLGILLIGRNVYCFRICPFYGVQFLLGKLSGSQLQLPPTLLARSKTITNILLWFALMIIFLSSHPSLGAYEPFAMMFSLQGIGVQWYILPIAIIGAFFMTNYWCRFFCPVGRSLTTILQLRRKVFSRSNQIKPV